MNESQKHVISWQEHIWQESRYSQQLASTTSMTLWFSTVPIHYYYPNHLLFYPSLWPLQHPCNFCRQTTDLLYASFLPNRYFTYEPWRTWMRMPDLPVGLGVVQTDPPSQVDILNADKQPLCTCSQLPEDKPRQQISLGMHVQERWRNKHTTRAPSVQQQKRQEKNWLSLSLRFNGYFPGEPGLAGVYWSKGWWRWWWQLDY